MLILKMIMRITGFTQEELSQEIGISRTTLNNWLKGDTISSNYKQIIANKFNFPITFFDIDLNQDLQLYKAIYSTLEHNYQKMHLNSSNETKADSIIDELECDFHNFRNSNISDADILFSLSNGANPYTGELYSGTHILNDSRVKDVLHRALNVYKHNGFITSKEDLNSEQAELFEKLRQWRIEKAREENYYHAYLVFNDKELINIILAGVKTKNDLRKVSGIGQIKYEKYADELFDIISGNDCESFENDNDYVPYSSFNFDEEIDLDGVF